MLTYDKTDAILKFIDRLQLAKPDPAVRALGPFARADTATDDAAG